MTTIPLALRDAARRFGDEPAIGATLSFAGLDAEADAWAAGLIAAGVEPGDRVALWARNSPEWVVASFAIYRAGGILVPINTRYKAAEAEHILRTSRARLLIVDDDVAVVTGFDTIRLADWSSLVERGTTVARTEVVAREAAIGPDDTSDIIFTSGTTGAPKGAMLGHGASVRTYEAWSELVGLRRGDRYLVVYPFFHTAGLKSGILACILTGAAVHPHAVFDVPAVMRRVAEERITMLPGPPTVFQSILNHPDLATFDLSSLRLSVTGAAVVPVDIVRRMREDLRLENVVTGYGLTETTGTVSMCRHDDPPEVIATTVGRPLPGVELRVVDDAGNDLPAGHAGELLVRGFNVMQGYFDDPGATAEALDPDGWLRTGDVALIGTDGNLRITDRKKDMYIVGGFNAYPAEIENMMAAHPAVAQVAVVGIPNERMGELGVAFVVPRSGVTAVPEEIIGWCRERMANFKVPSRVEIVDELPLTPSGKVMKFLLREAAHATR